MVHGEDHKNNLNNDGTSSASDMTVPFRRKVENINDDNEIVTMENSHTSSSSQSSLDNVSQIKRKQPEQLHPISPGRKSRRQNVLSKNKVHPAVEEGQESYRETLQDDDVNHLKGLKYNPSTKAVGGGEGDGTGVTEDEKVVIAYDEGNSCKVDLINEKMPLDSLISHHEGLGRVWNKPDQTPALWKHPLELHTPAQTPARTPVLDIEVIGGSPSFLAYFLTRIAVTVVVNIFLVSPLAPLVLDCGDPGFWDSIKVAFGIHLFVVYYSPKCMDFYFCTSEEEKERQHKVLITCKNVSIVIALTCICSLHNSSVQCSPVTLLASSQAGSCSTVSCCMAWIIWSCNGFFLSLLVPVQGGSMRLYSLRLPTLPRNFSRPPVQNCSTAVSSSCKTWQPPLSNHSANTFWTTAPIFLLVPS